MFGYAPNEAALHNALIDVVACLRVFYRLWFQGIQFTEPDINVPIPVCGQGEPDIYLKLKSDDPINPIVRIINEFTPEGIEPVGIGSSSLIICPPIENDELESIMTGKSIKQIIFESKSNSRQSRYYNKINEFANNPNRLTRFNTLKSDLKNNLAIMYNDIFYVNYTLY